MRFGVIIRSIGERTEKLCLAAAAISVPKKDVHLVRDAYPSYVAFRHMFDIAEKHKYDWFLGLDADIVLRPNWHDLFLARLKSEGGLESVFRLHFSVKDCLTGQQYIRGNNWYNGKYAAAARRCLEKNIRIGRWPRIYGWFGYHSGYYTKPETSIRTLMSDKYGVNDRVFWESIGWHGYEQFYHEIFRQHVVRYARDQEYDKKDATRFLDAAARPGLLASGQMDKYVANIAWSDANRWQLWRYSEDKRRDISRFLAERGIKEKEPWQGGLDAFYRAREAEECAGRAR